MAKLTNMGVLAQTKVTIDMVITILKKNAILED
jgi:hypothetical protein